jgi:hypothetical protein
VELGKALAERIIHDMSSPDEIINHDSSTRALIRHYRSDAAS